MTESVARTRAQAVVTVLNYQPTVYDEPTEGPVLSRIHVEESFSGDITGAGVAQIIQAARADGFASFAGIERVTGEIGGQRGTFLFQVAGTVQGNRVDGGLSVIAGSGTGELAGFRGEGGFRATFGRLGQAHLDYWFE